MDPLTELGKKYGTDKVSKHHYGRVYYDLFKDRRDEVKKVLEIGVAEGAGVRMFRDFFPNAMIYGAEIENSRLLEEDRIYTVKCDQSRPEDLNVLLEITGTDLDLVIDDGSHRPEDQISTFLTVMPKLNKGAIYVIEDVAKPDIVNYFAGYDYKVKSVGGRYDDRLVICRK